MPLDNPFADDWRECLRAHYTYVIRLDDQRTERTLNTVMHQAGFTDAELAELRVLATLRVEDMGEDFVPNLDILQAETAEQVKTVLAEAEQAADPPSGVIALPELPEEEPVSDADLDELPPPADAPQQLSLF